MEIVPDGVKATLKGTAAEELYYHFWANGVEFIDVKIDVGGKEFALHAPRNSMQYDHLQSNNYEPELFLGLFESIGEDSVFFDVGSYFGLFSEFSDSLNAHRTYSFEASTPRYNLMNSSPAIDPKHTFNTYVSSENGDKQTQLDSFAESHDYPDVVKIDVEGAEMGVLQGMKNILEEGSTVFIEVHPSLITEFGNTVKDLTLYLDSAGYEIHRGNYRDNDNSFVWKKIEPAQPEINERVQIKATPE